MPQETPIAPTRDECVLRALVERIVSQDQAAFEALYDHCVARVHCAVRRIVHDSARAEEVVEDTFFQVWREAARFDPQRGAVIGWLFTIARSRALDALRRDERNALEVSLDDDDDRLVELSAAESGQPSCQVESARSVHAVQVALAALEPQPRQLVSLAFLRGLTHEEVAASTGLPLGTVKSSIRRALSALRQALGANMSPDVL